MHQMKSNKLTQDADIISLDLALTYLFILMI